MKIIDLLNKIANGKDVPNIRYCDRLLKYNEEENWFEEIDGYTNYCKNYFLLNELNDEIEIIEEDKKTEKIKSLNNVGYCPNLVEFGDKQQLNNHILKDKINEIIDKLNEGEDKE